MIVTQNYIYTDNYKIFESLAKGENPKLSERKIYKKFFEEICDFREKFKDASCNKLESSIVFKCIAHLNPFNYGRKEMTLKLFYDKLTPFLELIKGCLLEKGAYQNLAPNCLRYLTVGFQSKIKLPITPEDVKQKMLIPLGLFWPIVHEGLLRSYHHINIAMIGPSTTQQNALTISYIQSEKQIGKIRITPDILENFKTLTEVFNFLTNPLKEIHLSLMETERNIWMDKNLRPILL